MQMVEKIRKYTRIAGFAATWDTKKAGKHHPQWHNDTPSTFKNKRTQGDSSIIKQKKLQTRIFAGLESKKKEHETGIEPATPSLARRCSTAEPLAHVLTTSSNIPNTEVFVNTIFYFFLIFFIFLYKEALSIHSPLCSNLYFNSFSPVTGYT